MIELSIVIVAYKNKKLIDRVVDSIDKRNDWEIIIIDNTRNNRGFSKACNLGAKRAKGKYIFFLNPDSVVFPGSIKKLLAYFKQHDEVGIIGPQLLDEEKQPYSSVTRFPTRKAAFVVYSVLNRLFAHTQVVKDYRCTQKSLDDVREVETISGAAMMMKKDVFEKVGGFDERFFLYWEDFDLSKRVRDLGLKVVYYPEAKVIHTRAGVTPKSDPRVLAWFRQARYQFFQKYYGKPYALVLEAFLTALEEWRFLVILAVAAFLRFYRLPELMPLLGDQGRDFLAALEVVRGGEIPLLGIPSSVPRFRQGPLYVWFLSLVFALFGADPVAAGIFAAVLGLLAVGFTYILTAQHFNRTTALFAALFLATSPLAVTQARLAFHTNAIPLFSLILLSRLWKKPYRWGDVFWVSLSFALLFQFELAIFPLFGLVLWYWYRSWAKVKPWRGMMGVLGGLLTGLAPQLIYDIGHSFSQLGLFLVWTGYRIMSFFGFDSEHTASTQKMVNVFWRFKEYFSKYYSWGYPFLAMVLIALSVVFIVVRSIRFRQLKSELQTLILWIGLIMVAFFVHGGPSEAYFPILFAPLAMILGLLSRTRLGLGKITTVLILTVAIVNGYFLIRHDFLVSSPETIKAGILSPYGAPLATQIEVAKLIQDEASGRPVWLVAKGAGAEFDSFLDNYKFLLEANDYPLREDGLVVLIGEEAYFKEIIVPNTKFYTIDGIMVGFSQ